METTIENLLTELKAIFTFIEGLNEGMKEIQGFKFTTVSKQIQKNVVIRRVNYNDLEGELKDNLPEKIDMQLDVLDLQLETIEKSLMTHRSYLDELKKKKS